MVPVTIVLRACTVRNLLTGMFYASLASVVADVLVSELLCGLTSELRRSFLRRILGEEWVGRTACVADKDAEERAEAREAASRQVWLMKRQTDAATAKEEKCEELVVDQIRGDVPHTNAVLEL